MGVILDGSWGGRAGSGDLRGMGGGGGERNTNSYAMIRFCVRVEAVYIHLARFRLFMV